MPSSVPVSLPIDVLIPSILESLKRHHNLVVEAQPGAGKTTRIPPALLQHVAGEVVVLEPRRIAARMSARRVAEEMGEPLGQTVGYQVRFEEVSGPKTRLRFVTEGVLTRRMLSDPMLQGVDCVVLDEFHERHLETDLALALLKRLQQIRSSLHILIMSATLDTAPVAAFLGDCPVLRSQGRVFPVQVQFQLPASASLEVQVANAADQLLRDGERGNMLAFLPGAAEIHRTLRAAEALRARYDLAVLPLYGSLSPAEQDAAIAPSSKQKLILATNVAESSLTIDGVTAVIDSGWARVAEHSRWTGLPSLQLKRVSKASATQRAGRAGRTAPGRAIRLYPEEDYNRRAAFDAPEIERSELSQLLLTLRSMGIESVNELPWLTPPPESAVQHAATLLDLLNAHGEQARALARYPLPPRLARVMVEAARHGAAAAASKAVAVLATDVRSASNDLLTAADASQDGRTAQQAAQLRRIAKASKDEGHQDEALLKALVMGFPDRIGRRGAGTLLHLSNGITAEVVGHALQYPFVVALEMEDRSDKPQPQVRMTSRVEPDWLLDLFPERIAETTEVAWNRNAERVESVTVLRYDQLTLQEWRDGTVDAEAAAAMLAARAMEAGITRFVDAEALALLQARFVFAGLGEPDVERALREAAYGLKSFQELRTQGAAILQMLESSEQGRRLQELAPVSIGLRSGRQTRVHYEEGKPPWIASRLQDFFGMKETPRIGRQREPVVVHLLAPNGRAVQTTTDLAGFWVRLYPQVRKELMRRYPRHQWPEAV